MMLSLEFSGFVTPMTLNLGSAFSNNLLQSSKSRSFALWIAHIDKSNDLGLQVSQKQLSRDSKGSSPKGLLLVA